MTCSRARSSLHSPKAGFGRCTTGPQRRHRGGGHPQAPPPECPLPQAHGTHTHAMALAFEGGGGPAARAGGGALLRDVLMDVVAAGPGHLRPVLGQAGGRRPETGGACARASLCPRHRGRIAMRVRTHPPPQGSTGSRSVSWGSNIKATPDHAIALRRLFLPKSFW